MEGNDQYPLNIKNYLGIFIMSKKQVNYLNQINKKLEILKFMVRIK